MNDERHRLIGREDRGAIRSELREEIELVLSDGSTQAGRGARGLLGRCGKWKKTLDLPSLDRTGFSTILCNRLCKLATLRIRGLRLQRL